MRSAGEEKPLAERLFNAQRAYSNLHCDLDDAVVAIFGGEDALMNDTLRVKNWSVEQDSATDNSIEIQMAPGHTLTDADRAALKALGFSIIWNDARSAPKQEFSRPEIARLLTRHEAEVREEAIDEIRYIIGLLTSALGVGGPCHSADVKNAKDALVRLAAALRAGKGQGR